MGARRRRDQGCLLCDPAAADAALDRTEVWSDATWRLTMALRSEVLRGQVTERRLPGGAAEYVSSDFPLLNERELRDLADRVHHRLRGESTGRRTVPS